MLMKAKLYLVFKWTAVYAIFATVFFAALFGFNIWAAADWNGLWRIAIRGLDGLAFAASVLAIIPLYISTACFTWKHGKFPVKIPVPFSTKISKDAPADEPQPIKHVEVSIPNDLPDEMRELYIQAHSGSLAHNISDLLIDRLKIRNKEPAVTEFMPLPQSFDFDDAASVAGDFQAPESPNLPDFSVLGEPRLPTETPTFSDFSFDDTEEKPAAKAYPNFTDNGKVAEYVFDDPDFWIADDVGDWFANGKQIESPIKLLLDSKSPKKVLHLKTNKIADLQECVNRWEELGIKIVNS